ncbi:MAG TPA: M28 family peptidase [Ferruginibacter sp.]|nr:M28 family peptidase [Ferruginibacter sp.]
MRFLFGFLCLVGVLNASAQSKSETYAQAIRIADLQQHLGIIAGDEMEGRETGTEGQRKAAAYIENHFRSLGLNAPVALNGYQQYFPLYQDSLLSCVFSIRKKEAVYGTDYICPAMNNDNRSWKSKGIVFAGYGIEDTHYNDYTTLDVTNKVVIVMLGEPKSDGKYLVTGTNKPSEWTFPGIGKKLKTAASKGALAVLFINPTQPELTSKQAEGSRKTNVYYPRKSDQPISQLQLSHAFAKQLLGETTDALIKKASLMTVYDGVDYVRQSTKLKFSFEENHQLIQASNVVGMLEGTDKKDEYVFITGHYDHLGKRDGKIYYGADDDGSGTVAVMQMATAFVQAAKEGNRPRRTLVFMTVSGEEKGLWGSEYYSENPVFPLDKTSVDLNIDMIGRVDTERKTDDTLNYVYVVGHDKISTELPLINEGMNKQYSNLVLDYKFDDPNDPNRIYYRSDHYNFARKGVPVLFFYDGMLKADYHKPTDTVDKINWLLYQKRAQMIFHTAWEMANRDEMLQRDLPIPTGTR